MFNTLIEVVLDAENPYAESSVLGRAWSTARILLAAKITDVKDEMVRPRATYPTEATREHYQTVAATIEQEVYAFLCS